MLALCEAGQESAWLASFRAQTRLKTRYAEIDSYGHVSNVVYPDYLEVGRMDYLKLVGDPEPHLSIFPFEHVCAELHLRFIRPCYFDEELLVHTKTARLGRSSATLEQAITQANDGSLRAIATAIIVRNDGSSSKSWSQQQRAALRAFDSLPA
ncbi:MAG: acyl-CoA thioesterase [Candidatus Eremiobacteraeota bacterium]|nr:acyl-CoA thioesterase [Candidatus Eremiobacteraeota bacterium]